MNKVIVTDVKTRKVSTFKSAYRCDDITVEQLPFHLSEKYIAKDTPLETLVHDYVGATIEHEQIDGRSREAERLRYFTMRYLFESF